MKENETATEKLKIRLLAKGLILALYEDGLISRIAKERALAKVDDER